MNGVGCLLLVLMLLLAFLLPLAFGQLFSSALLKLHLSPDAALLLIIAILVGSAVNIPIKRIARKETVLVDPLAVLGLAGFWPRLQRVRNETVIAANVGASRASQLGRL